MAGAMTRHIRPPGPGPIGIMVCCCDPWDSYMEQLVADCMALERAEQIEADLERERDLRPPTEAANVEYVETELLAEVQR